MCHRSAHVGVYCFLVKAYPVSFRAKVEQEMVILFSDQLGACTSLYDSILLWGWTLLDLVWSIPREYVLDPEGLHSAGWMSCKALLTASVSGLLHLGIWTWVQQCVWLPNISTSSLRVESVTAAVSPSSWLSVFAFLGLVGSVTCCLARLACRPPALDGRLILGIREAPRW